MNYSVSLFLIHHHGLQHVRKLRKKIPNTINLQDCIITFLVLSNNPKPKDIQNHYKSRQL